MSSLRILHSITDLNVGGAEIMLYRFLARQDRESFDPTVLSLMHPGAVGRRVSALNVKVHSLDMAPSRPRASDAVKLACAVRRSAPDLIHGWMYHGNIAASVGSWLSFRFKPVIWSVHHSLSDIAKEKLSTQRLINLSVRISSTTSAICYCSKVSARQHEDIGFDSRRSVIIPNGVDCADFRPRLGARDLLKNKLRLPPNRFVVGTVGRYHPMKDHVSLVGAISLLVQRGFDVQGVFVGVGEDNMQVRQAASNCGIEGRITTLATQDDVPEWIGGFDVFALSSAWGEAFPLSVSEAMASGVPPVVTDVGDCAWLVGSAGRVVPPNDGEALASALGSLLELNLDAREALGLSARQRIIENFSLDEYVSRKKALYEAVLDRA